MKAVPWIATLVLVLGLLVAWRHAVGLDAKLQAVTDAYAADRAAWADTVRSFDARLARLRADSAEAYRDLAASRSRLNSARAKATAAEARLMAALASASDSGSQSADGRLEDVAAIVTARAACEEALQASDRALTGCEARATAERERAMAALAEISKRESTIAELEDLAKPNLLRDFWRARVITLPLLGAVALLAVLR